MQPAVYIITNKRDGALYIGVTANLLRSIYLHKNNMIPGFASKYGCNMLVFYEYFARMSDAILAKKKLKKKLRTQKVRLIEKRNPLWVDLSVVNETA